MNCISDFLITFWNMLCEMAPYLLLGFLFAGIMHAFLPKSFYKQHLSKPNFATVMKAALFGVPLPLCSCGVIPTALALRNEGASKGATVSFLIATPQTGVDSIAATYSMLGLPMAIIRPVVAFFTAILGGATANRFDKSADVAGNKSVNTGNEDCVLKNKSFASKSFSALRYGFFDMMQNLGRWLAIGLAAAALITIIVPDDFFAKFSQYPLLGMLVVLAISVPMYICATGSIPIALALMMKGLSPGAALVLLMAGPATNIASILMIYKVLGRKTTFIYVASIVMGALAFGLAIDYLLPPSWFTIITNVSRHECCAASTHAMPHWFMLASGIVLSLMMLVGIITRYVSASKHSHNHDLNLIQSNMKEYKIDGMMCNHCRANVEKGLQALPGVKSVNVDLAKGIAQVEGEVKPEEVISKVESLGYTCSVI